MKAKKSTRPKAKPKKRDVPATPSGNASVRIQKIENGYLVHEEPASYRGKTKTTFHESDPLKK